MNPDITQQNDTNIPFQTFMNRLIQDVTLVTDANVSRTVSTTGDSAEVLDYPDRWLRVLHNGRTYRIPAYLESEDASR